MADRERRLVTAPYRTSEATLRAEVERLTRELAAWLIGRWRDQVSGK